MRTVFSLIAILLALPATASAAESFAGLDDQGALIRFASDTARGAAPLPVSGLGPDERLIGLDVRPANGQLVAVSTANRLYTLDPGTGAATPIGSGFQPALTSPSIGFDFNPTVDRIRLVNDLEQDLRLNPITGGTAATDMPLRYAADDPGAGNDPAVTGSAYTNNRAGATTTELLGIDAARDVVVFQNPPNDGVLRTRGSLGIATTEQVGFDIGADGRAWAAMTPANAESSNLYTISVSGGPAQRQGTIAGRPLVGLAALGPIADDTSPPDASVSARSSISLRSLRSGGLRTTLRCAEYCSTRGELRLAGRRIGAGFAETSAGGGNAPLRLRLTRRGARALEREGGGTVLVVASVVDGARNTTRLSESVRVRASR